MSASGLNRLLAFLILALLVVIIFYLCALDNRISNLELKKVFTPTAAQLKSGDTNGHQSYAMEKSYLLNLDSLDSRQKRTIIYNRVPKTGSTSLMGLAYDLCDTNHFNVIHINTSKNSHVLSLPDQAYLAGNISSWTEKIPAIYHGHIAFLDFTRFGVANNPIYINLIRDPISRLVSHYYFLRYGDDFRPKVVRRRQGDKISFDECVRDHGKDCDPKNMWIQIPFFCGHFADCWSPANQWALSEAKRNLVQHYLVVGITEQMHEFVAMLEYTLPNYFKGALKKYQNGQKSHLRKTNYKREPSSETVKKIQQSKVWQMENEFYSFAVQHFNFIKQKTLVQKEDTFIDKGRQFFYEKIRPK